MMQKHHPVATSNNIERLFIAYFGLCEAVTEQGLDEDASEAELLEEVLFDSSSCASSVCYTAASGERELADNSSFASRFSTSSSSSATAERLAFLGLCKALYQLPGAFAPQEKGEEPGQVDDGHANTVELEHCTLLFVPLEQQQQQKGIMRRSSTTSNLVAIVQLKKVPLRTVSLMAIQNAVECSHALFCLLDQWGIMRLPAA
jgi:hypothetical protein